MPAQCCGSEFSVTRVAVTVAAVVTVVAAVAMDVLAGEHPVHSATIGLIAVVVAAARVRSAGNHRSYFSSLSGAIVAQPAFHAATKAFPATPETLAGHAAESSVSVAHVLLAALVVAFVSGAEALVLLLNTVDSLAWLLWLLGWPRRRRTTSDAGSYTTAVPGVRRLIAAGVSLRGPPQGEVAIA